MKVVLAKDKVKPELDLRIYFSISISKQKLLPNWEVQATPNNNSQKIIIDFTEI